MVLDSKRKRLGLWLSGKMLAWREEEGGEVGEEGRQGRGSNRG